MRFWTKQNIMWFLVLGKQHTKSEIETTLFRKALKFNKDYKDIDNALLLEICNAMCYDFVLYEHGDNIFVQDSHLTKVLNEATDK